MRLARSTCPYDCPDACGLLVEIDGDRAVSVRGDPDHPWSRGSLCPKMTRYPATVHSPDRLTTPLLRAGPKGAGTFRPTTWEHAIALVAERWRSIVAADGAQAILPYSYAGTMGLVQRNAGHAFFHALGASRLDRTICAPAKDAGWKAIMGESVAPDPEEAARSDLVVLWGIDALATNLHFVSRAREARRRGGRIFVVETYATPTAALADRVFLVRPGSDGALAMGIMHLLVRDGLVDRAFADAHVQGLDELARDVLPEWTPARTAAATGLPEADLLELTHALAAARAPFLRLGSGMSRYANGATNVRTVLCLPALLGAWARPGGGALCSTSSTQAFDLSVITREDLQPGPTRLVNMNRLGDALLSLGDPPVRSLFVYASNPAAVAPDQNAVLAGLSREDLFTVVHERFLTDTARYADVVLPATTSLEHADLYRAYGHYAIQRTAAVLPPVGESKSNWDVFRLLAAAMGLRDPMFRLATEQLIDLLLARPAPMREGLDAAALAAGRAVMLRIDDGAKARFRTPSGRIEIRNPRLAHPLPCVLPTHVEAEAEGAAARARFPLRLMTAPSLHGLNSTFLQERDDLRARAGPMALQMSPFDAAARGLSDGERVEAWNELGEVLFTLQVTPAVPQGVVVAPGVRKLEDAPGRRNVNALTHQRLTDLGAGSTFYDNAIDVRSVRPPAAPR